ncbi:MAG: AbgT family transporter [Candidatus Eisenbacteria bacterium]|uniref:AbgT family transporter n=1 Tax=Eiseniibacteriota bacterium TaxID=2212470 RepID=A0A933SE87_UNCEI|nr:AbgT family transporter [Candidatus Eisenbacteria bacterium]
MAKPFGAPAAPASRGALARTLDAVERVGNLLPDTLTLFAALAVLIVAASWLCAKFGVSVVHPRDGSLVTAVNLLDRAGVQRMCTEAVKNFTNFPPLGTVLVAMIGMGLAEKTGLLEVSLRALVANIPARMLTMTVVLASLLAHLGADAAIVMMPPLGAMIFAAAGRHPLAGVAAAFAGVTGGFSANVLPSTLDVLLVGISQAALDASKLSPGYTVQLLGNYFFLFAASPVLVIAGAWVTDRIVEPRLGTWHGEREPLRALTPEQKRGLWWAFTSLFVLGAVYWTLIVPSWAPLRTEGASLLLRMKPAFDSMVVLITLLFFIPGLAYGLGAGTVKSDKDVAAMTGDSMGSMGLYIVLAFVAAQFVSYFAWSNLGTIIAVSGAAYLKSVGLAGAPLLVTFVAFAATLNLLITSASAKWAILAPVFVPMFVLLGFTPEATQAVFRIGDSCTNIITPMLPYVPFILTVMRKYDPKVGTGTLITMMLPYSTVFIVLWTALLLVFYFAHWQIGPGVQILLGR